MSGSEALVPFIGVPKAELSGLVSLPSLRPGQVWVGGPLVLVAARMGVWSGPGEGEPHQRLGKARNCFCMPCP